jgi:hypothetical protein
MKQIVMKMNEMEGKNKHFILESLVAGSRYGSLPAH